MPSKALCDVDYDEVIDDKATSICLAIGDKEVWIPKVVIHGVIPEPESGHGSIVVEEWFAFKKELI